MPDHRRTWKGFCRKSSAGFAALLGLTGPLTHPLIAGDILRGSAPVAATRAKGNDSAINAATEQARNNARDALARTTQALNAVRAMQSAARSLALRGPNNLGADPNHPGQILPNVPNGLTTGGLEVDPAVSTNASLWRGANLPTQSGRGGRVTVTVKQNEQTAVLNWKTFNIGKNTTLYFDQYAGGEQVGQWVAFNKINDPSGSPSQILGSIQAPGQVYVINQNGIIFGGSSQVNVHTLAASSLPINDGLIERGLLNNPDTQFLFSALPIPAGAKGTPAFTPPEPNTPDGRVGDVEVRAGAQLYAPTSAEHVGGRIALIGANVKNAGTISTPDGQTILAAGLQVGFDAHDSNDPTLRGLDVYIGAVIDPSTQVASSDPGAPPTFNPPPYAGTATNSGLIDAPRANVTIAGKTVNQLGTINSSTSVSLNGRIDLIASYDAVGNPNYDSTNTALGLPFLNRSTGTVNLGAGSVMQILPEWESAEKVVGTELALRSQVNIQGKAIHFEPDSILFAPSADVTISAGVWDYVSAPLPGSEFVYSGGQIYIDSNVLINVAGSTDVVVPMSENILEVELRGAELADVPIQRTSLLRGIELTVDVRRTGVYNGKEWVGTPLGDVSGYVGLIERSAGELTTAGGSVTMKSGGSVVMKPGSTIDVSGGFANVEGGMIETTKVISGGRIYNIWEATPDQLYQGIYTGEFTTGSARWGITETFKVPFMTGPHYEPGYVDGANGGRINIASPAMALDGTLLGNTIAGQRQREVLPEHSGLELRFEAQIPDYESLYPLYSPTPPKIVFQNGGVLPAVKPFQVDEDGNPAELPEARLSKVFLSPELLTKQGFGSLTVYNPDGDITVPGNVGLEAPPLGSISLTGANVSIQGTVTAPGGDVSITVHNISPADAAALMLLEAPMVPAAEPARGLFTLGASASINTAGLIVDDRLVAPAPLTQPFVLDGGHVSIESFSARLARGSVIDVSGGVAVDAWGRKTYGDAGSISIKAGKDPVLEPVVGGRLRLGATLLGYSGATGGSLTIQAPKIQIGGVLRDPRTLYLSPDFFSEGGFSNFTLIGLGEWKNRKTDELFSIGEILAAAESGEPLVTPDAESGDETTELVEEKKFAPAIFIAPGTQIKPVATSLLAVPVYENGIARIDMRRIVRPEGLRNPVSLGFQAPGIRETLTLNKEIIARGDIIFGQGAKIETDALASVSFVGQTVQILGSVIAPAGTIIIGGADKFPSEDTEPETAYPTVFIGPQSQLSVAGTTLLFPDRWGHRNGVVLPGGTISVSGNIIAARGATLDVSGTSDVLDVHPAYLNLNATLNGPLVQPIVPVSSGITMPLWQSLAVPTRIDSDAGLIVLEGGEMLFTRAALIGKAGGPTALGGSLSISSGRFYAVDEIEDPRDINLVVSQTNRTRTEQTASDPTNTPLLPFAFPFLEAGKSPIGEPLVDRDGNPIFPMGYFAANNFLAGGFDNLKLGGSVAFSGPVTIPARGVLDVADGGIIWADSRVVLSAPYVRLGTVFDEPMLTEDLMSPFQGFDEQGNFGPISFPPTYGPGKLIVRAGLIDVGFLSLQNIGEASLFAKNDIRGSGSFDIAGKLNLTAGQIYPVTASQFTITAYDKNIAVASSKTGSTQVTLASAVLPQDFGVGDPLLGSIVRSIDGATVTLESGANRTITELTYETFEPGSGTVNIRSSGTTPQFPYSAGGQLNIYGSVINQGGVLRAPLGSINIGWDGTGTAPQGLVTGMNVPVTRELTLLPGSITSVSAIDPISGAGVIIPYGINKNGTAWIDPTGFDITASGAPLKSIKLGAANLETQSGSTIDIRGGGDLYAYRWVKGNGGTQDALASADSFAVIPGYTANYSPFAPFNDSGSVQDNLNGDPGYVNGNLSVGDRIYLSGSDALPAGVYTLLPARYALLPGAVLVTPKDGMPVGSFNQLDGSSLVAGYRFNDLTGRTTFSALYQRFEVAPAATVRARSEYEDYFGNTFFPEAAAKLDVDVKRLPVDAGYLLLQASSAMNIQGNVQATSPFGGRGGVIDINSPVDVIIAGAGAGSQEGKLVLDSSLLNSWGAESILIGGARTFGLHGVTQVSVRTNNITVDNEGTPFMGPEIILAANRSLILAPGAQIAQSGVMGGPADLLIFGDPNVPGSGDGTMLRVSSDESAAIFRSGIAFTTAPTMTISSGVSISGASIILDSTYATFLDPTTALIGDAISLHSGQISIQLDEPGPLQPTVGMVLTGPVLQGLRSTESLSLLSYSSIDIYGAGEFGNLGSLAFHAGEIRGFNTGGESATFTANTISLDNLAGSRVVTKEAEKPLPMEGQLVFDADTIQLGVNQLEVNRFEELQLLASVGMIATGGGGLSTAGRLSAVTPYFTAAEAATYIVAAGGELSLAKPEGSQAAPVAGGLGASITLEGASVAAFSDILLPSGLLTLHATSGDVVVGGRIDVSGTAQTFYDLVRYTDAGQVTLAADQGSVMLTAGSQINVAAHADGGDAGSLTINAPKGSFELLGALYGKGGVGGTDGAFNLDARNLPEFALLNNILNAGSFTESRTIRVRDGDVTVTGFVKAHIFSLAADHGSINVTGTIDASGLTGGSIDLTASGNVTLASGSLLTVAAQQFDNAGKGGRVSIEAGSQINGVVNPSGYANIQSGSTINLSVASGTSSSALYGQFSGTLHIRAPQTAGNTNLQVSPINGTILGASHIMVEGYQLFDLTNTGGAITNSGSLKASGGLMVAGNNVQGSVNANANLFIGNTAAITAALLAANPGLDPLFVLAPGAEIINRTGNLTLGSPTSPVSQDWNLQTFRYGADKVPGVLTMRAAGDLIFYNALSDGFNTTLSTSTRQPERLWTAPLMDQNTLLPTNLQSWTFRLVAGADLTAADYHELKPLDELTGGVGSLKLGKDTGQAIPSGITGSNALTRLAINPTGSSAATAINYFQVIRTGTGDIDIVAGRDVQLLNQFATIYTAGVPVVSATSIFSAGDFVLPIVTQTFQPSQGGLGAVQQSHRVQYSMAGGNVSVVAQGDIEHLTKDALGNLIPDSTRQLPNNWLYRRGYVDPATGQFGSLVVGSTAPAVISDPAASTTWWIDFTNFFEGIGALGGGNVTLIAGNDISNVDAVIPTNARMPKGTPDASKLVELGGGDLVVRAGNNIDGGVYYVERGTGTLIAGGSITTNKTRSPSLGILNGFSDAEYYGESTWLPTTLFVGKGSFDVSARGDVLLGPIANPFLLAQGLNNRFWYKTYFTTYAADSAVTVSSLGGDVTLRESITLPDATDARPALQVWMEKELLLTPSSSTSAYYQPWLRLAETSIEPFGITATLATPTLKATAFSGDINLVGNLTLFPSPTGTIDLLAKGAIIGLQPTGTSSTLIQGDDIVTAWTSSTLNLSDANPASVPGVASPFSYLLVGGSAAGDANTTSDTEYLAFINNLFRETGSFTGAAGVIQTKQALHSYGPLHIGDFQPVHLYAGAGDISGLTLFSGKAARILAGNDITDISFYIQNVRDSDVTVIASGRDIIAYNPNSELRVLTQSTGNALVVGETDEAGDIQISGPGTLEVLAGRDLDLGVGPNNPNGTGFGIVSIGNSRNPYLSFEGADIIVGAGIGSSAGIGNSALDFASFIDEFVNGEGGTRYLSELNTPMTLDEFESLSSDQQNRLALELFFIVLRDAGRDHNVEGSAGYGSYDAGFAAIESLFPGSSWEGDISLTSREIKTKSGGDIHLFAPGGQLTVGFDVEGTQPLDQGILTEHGGDIMIFTKGDVNLGTSRIFTLRGGDIMIWSSEGDIAAGASSKTVKSAPPTRVLIDPQSGDVQTDLAGLATGGGIGVLTTVQGVPPGDVDLIAPFGVVDAGDAGIRVSGNLNIAATAVLNASNISVGGTSVGTPIAPVVSAPNIGGLAAVSATAAAGSSAAEEAAKQARASQPPPTEEAPSIITVEVLGYGGGSEETEDEEDKRKRSSAPLQ